jgi:hypothetical protein
VILAISVNTDNLFSSFFFTVGIAITLWIGLIREGVLGVSFGASYFLVRLIGSLFPGYFYLFDSWSDFVLSAIVLAIYGYIPARYYSNRKTRRALVWGFFISFFLDMVISFPSMLYFMMIPIAFRLILGGLAAWLCYRHLNLGLQPTKPVTYPPMPLPTPRTSTQQRLQCSKCGFDNSSTSNYCGRCGSLLKEETVYY